MFGYAFPWGGVTYGERFDIRFKTLSSRMRKLGYVCGVLTSAKLVLRIGFIVRSLICLFMVHINFYGSKILHALKVKRVNFFGESVCNCFDHEKLLLIVKK